MSKVGEVGLNLVKGLWNGISNAKDWVLNKIKGFGQSVLNGLKSFFGIASPSKLMEKEVGKYLAEGIGVGFSREMQAVSSEMQDAIPTSFDTNVALNGSNSYGYNLAYDNLVNSFKEALSQMKIELDDEVAGRFVEDTVSRAIYA